MLRRFFVLMSAIWLTSLVCLSIGYPQPGFVIFVSYALNALGCLLFASFSGVEIVDRTEDGE